MLSQDLARVVCMAESVSLFVTNKKRLKNKHN